MEGSLWQKYSLLQQTMTLLQGPKDPVLPTLVYIVTWTNTFMLAFEKTCKTKVKSNAKSTLTILPKDGADFIDLQLDFVRYFQFRPIFIQMNESTLQRS